MLCHRLRDVFVFTALLAGASGPAIGQVEGLDEVYRGEATETGARTALGALNEALPNPAGDSQCLPEPAAHADQMMRLHTELMLASLACEESWGSDQLYAQYAQFTYRMQTLLENGLEEMRRHLTRQGASDSLAAFDSYRTAIANEEAQELRELGTVTYCNMMSYRFDSLIDARPEQFEDYVEDVTGRLLSRVGVCGN
ncbi:MAG: hypothetical protein RLO50_12700 [Azospirillaceae bacterium]